ncbi:MAG: DMT family transporter [Lachnospiraceae bacterium]|nr:DMT family transporter [Lachnospiraceae bacterium]MBQ2320300.1 DMT family transporter [Lachnospiraceae bacterium]
MKSLKNSLMLFLTALIWGVAFVAQSVSAEYIGAFTFNGIRCFLGGLVLLPFIMFTDKKRAQTNDKTDSIDYSWKNKKLLTGGILCGIILCIASNLQQIGITYTTVGKAGFITALYVVLVPIAGIFLHKKTSVLTWISVVLSVIGLYLLCIKEDISIQKGDFYVLLCAIVFTLHIIIIDYFVNFVDGVKMSCIQFFVCSVLSFIVMLFTETPDMNNIFSASVSILYAGILSCGVAYTLQIVGQKGINPTVASLILCLESVISALAGWLILGQKLSTREFTGCALMFTAIILSQIPVEYIFKKKQTA